MARVPEKTCIGCRWNQSYVHLRDGRIFPGCDLYESEPGLFAEFKRNGVNFFGELLSLTGQVKPNEFEEVINAYGTAPKASDCIGSGVPE